MPLRTDYTNDILDTSKNTERKYNIKNSNGTIVEENVTFEDVTEYEQEGSRFGASDINATNTEVNRLNQNLTDLVKKVSIVGTTNNSGNYIITSDIKEYVDNGYVPIAYLNKSTASGIIGVQGVIWKHTTGDWYVKIYTSTGGVSTAYFDGYIYLIKVS